MTRKEKMENLHFALSPWANRIKNDDGSNGEYFGIDWDCELGCGRWELEIGPDGKAHIYTECMDKGDDKEFSKAILAAFLEQAVIEE